MFVKVNEVPPTRPAPKRHSMGVFPTPFSLPPLPDDDRRSPQSDGGRRAKNRTSSGSNGVVNVSFSTAVPDIKIREYNESDDEMSV